VAFHFSRSEKTDSRQTPLRFLKFVAMDFARNSVTGTPVPRTLNFSVPLISRTWAGVKYDGP
jgi:hypothetical protein